MEQEPVIPVDDPIAVRKLKREALISAGEEPYARRFDVSAKAKELELHYEQLESGARTEDSVQIAGRVMAIRDQGKVVFIVLRDGSGEIQLFVTVDTLGEEAFRKIKELDVGDWIGAGGTVMRTRRGQLSVSPASVVLLSKSLRPLPEKFHGLADKETRYRQRYVDLIANPDVKEVFLARFRIISALRREAEAKGFMEVETPMLHPIPGGATARPFITRHNALDKDFYLRVAPELNLKRLLVGGFERVFEVNRSFRNEGMDYSHNPEFTMLEAYQAYTDYHGIALFTRELIQAAALAATGSLEINYQGTNINLAGVWPEQTMSELVSEAVGTKVSVNTSLDELWVLAKKYDIEPNESWGAGKIIFELYELLVEPKITQPLFVTEHPLETSPLAKRKAGAPKLTDRFELVICGKEYANGFSELNDPVDQRQRFAAQQLAKAAGDEEAMGYDEDYIRALEYGMPPAGGVGIGIDRLVMLLTDSASIRDVLLFPHMRDENV
jgi:lysyl-tRNA synthetase class 2